MHGVTHSKDKARSTLRHRVGPLRFQESASVCRKRVNRDVRVRFSAMHVIADWRNCFRDIAEILVVRGPEKSAFRTPHHASMHLVTLACHGEGSSLKPWIRFYIGRPSPVARGSNSPLHDVSKEVRVGGGGAVGREDA